jgi:hypothetical protein
MVQTLDELDKNVFESNASKVVIVVYISVLTLMPWYLIVTLTPHLLVLFQAIRPSHTKKPEKQHTVCDLTLSIGLWEDTSSDDADGSSSISEEQLPARPAAGGARRVAAVKEEESKPAALNLDLTISSSWLAWRRRRPAGGAVRDLRSYTYVRTIVYSYTDSCMQSSRLCDQAFSTRLYMAWQ